MTPAPKSCGFARRATGSKRSFASFNGQEELSDAVLSAVDELNGEE